ncbi:GmrSD restriction endonuclease domain-containing protein [Pseudarthrobacter sp. P1]|uniref:GmrSD restriction endonuclease domain-containing protein n=1 Tax=Pseudarthrobacter sp. P1 TaxID=3418418 RepID=UPI003CF10CC4
MLNLSVPPRRSLGVADFVFGGVLASVLFLATGCGGTGNAAVLAAVSTSPASASATATASATPTNGADTTPLDPDVVPVVAAGAAAAANPQPAYATKALDLLATLPVKGRAPKTGYSRDQFGAAWSDVDHNGCDTRNDILARDLTATTFKAGTHNCVVLTGALDDPYTAKAIAFTRGATTSSAVQIDHVVALSDAWQKGAQQLTAAQRMSLANDPLNLLAVDGPANQQKSDGDAATWLPANKGYRCPYVARQISVKATYNLWVTQAEHDAMATVLATCADALAPTSAVAPVVEPVETPAPVVAPAPAPAYVEPAPVYIPPAPAAPAAVSYANCTAARAAGAAPIYAGQPGYSSKLDRDGDGVACE